jgi:hypothetical protein
MIKAKCRMQNAKWGANAKGDKAVAKVARASSPASSPGVPSGFVESIVKRYCIGEILKLA